VRRLVAPVFVLLVCAFVAFGGLVIVAFAPRLATWHLVAIAAWLGGCAAFVVVGTFVARRKS